MPRYAQVVIGPAGSGKVLCGRSLLLIAQFRNALQRCCLIRRFLNVQSTYCKQIYEHCQSIGRMVHVVNLDPAAEHFEYPTAVGRTCNLHFNFMAFHP